MRSWMIAYVAGVVAFHCVSQILSIAESLFLLAVSVIFLLCLNRFRWLSFFLIACVWSSTYSDINKNKVLASEYESKNLRVTGYVCTIPKRTEQVTYFELCDARLYDQGSEPVADGMHLKLSWYAKRFKHSDNVKHAAQPEHLNTPLVGVRSFVVRLKRPHGLVNPNGFMYEKWLFRKGIHGVGYVKSIIGRDDVYACGDSEFKCSITSARIYINDYLSLLSDDLSSIPLIKALSVGYRGDISPEDALLLKNTGTQHLMAISGLHIGLVFGMAMAFSMLSWRVMSLMFRRANSELLNAYKLRSSVIVALFCALSYSALAGFLVSTQRALIMLVVFYVCGLSRRHIKSNTRLLIAATVVLVLDPNAVLDYGFWLSFMAVWVLFFATVRRVKQAKEKPLIKWFKASVSMQWVIFVGLCPVLLASGMGVSYTSLLANFVAIPWVGVIVVPLILIGLVVLPISPWLSELIMILANVSVDGLRQFLGVFGGFEAVAINNVTAANLVMIAIVAGTIILLPVWRSLKVWLLLVAILLVGFKPITASNAMPEVVIFDVGQGLAVAATSNNQVLVYDTGPAYRTGSAAKRSLEPYLKAKGFTYIHTLVISHGDDDHAGGLADLHSEFSIGKVITGQPERLRTSLPIERCHNQASLNLDGLEAKMFYLPDITDNTLTHNNQSCVVRVVINGLSVLLMGDIEKKAERQLVQYYGDELQSDVLVAGHHGSKHATSQLLINKVKPKQVVFSAGYRSRFNHPHPDAVRRASSQGATIYTTAESGAIVFKQNKTGEWITLPHRKQTGAFWLSTY